VSYFLQINGTEYVGRAFETSPDTVYGLLLGGSALVIIALGSAVIYLARVYHKTVLDAFRSIDLIADRLDTIEQKINKL